METSAVREKEVSQAQWVESLQLNPDGTTHPGGPPTEALELGVRLDPANQIVEDPQGLEKQMAGLEGGSDKSADPTNKMAEASHLWYCPDGSFVKKIIVHGRGLDKPKLGSQCRVLVLGFPFGSGLPEGWTELTIGVGSWREKSWGELTEKCLESMCQGEEAEIRLPGGAAPLARLKLDSFTQGRDSWELEVSEKEALAREEHARGTELFRAGNPKGAARCYGRALRLLLTLPPPGPPERTILHSNLAACQLLLGQPQLAAQNCDRVLEREPSHLKALYRRGVAQAALGNLEKAAADLKKVLAADPKNRAAQEELGKVLSTQDSDWSTRLPGRPTLLSEPLDLPRPRRSGPESRLMVGGGGKMAELMLLSEIADPTRFFTDNLLSPEDWDSTLYAGLDEVVEEQAQLFRCVEQDVPFDSSALVVGMDVSPPEPPWDPLPIFPDLQVKSEPSSPCSSSSLSSESSQLSTEPSSQAPVLGEVLHVKTESLAPPLCLLGDGPASPFETVQITVGSASDDASDIQTKAEPASPSSVNSEASLLSADSPSQALTGEEVLEVKTESPSPPGCLLWDVPAPSLGAVQISMGPSPDSSSGKAPLATRKPTLQPKPVVLTTVQMPPRAGPPSTTVLLQPLVQQPAVSPVVLIQGAIRVQPEGPATAVPRPERKSIVPAPMPGNSGPPEVDAKLLKRQQRMIKNRESACQSRRKKKEYLQGLEARLQAVLADNQQLRRENAALRRRLEALLAENSELKLGSGNRKVVCIMVFLLFIAFNFGPVSISEPPPAPISPRMSKGEPRPQRHLLEFSGPEPVLGVEPLQGVAQSPEELQPSPTGRPSFRNLTAFPGAQELLLRDLDQLFLASDCRHFNRTESLRLADELSGWVRRHQRGRRKIPQRTQERKKSQLRKKSPPVKPVPTQPPGPPERDSVGQLQLYRHPDRSQPEFLDAIDRREDTFYVVSFRRDHLLLPAISHNKTSRPKMSLVMPAMAPNETVSGRGAPGDYEEMMQIECEVMDTRVIHIKTSTVPPSLRKQPSPTPGNSTGGPLPASAASQTHQASHQPLYLNHP